jgi:hypothetical protein
MTSSDHLSPKMSSAELIGQDDLFFKVRTPSA